MKTPRTTLAQVRLSRLGGSLRQGLPGDGTPHTAEQARQHCRHWIMRHELVDDPRSPAPVLRSWSEPLGDHVCFGGWLL